MATEWIVGRLEGDFGAVTRTVPSGFAAYARICHPPADRDGRPVTWDQVARVTARQTHPLMQWDALVGSPDPLNIRGCLWPGSDPQRGHLAPELLRPLCDVLAGHTGARENCHFCLWKGYSQTRGAPATPTFPALSSKQMKRRGMHLPDRDYALLAGPLAAALQLGWWHSASWFEPHSPNLFWPADHAWCVASEIGFDSTLVGGPTELIDTILSKPTFDSWPVQPNDSLAAYADQINRSLRPGPTPDD